jgi:predicted lipoprotein with Yx(FWY)xxD motif
MIKPSLSSVSAAIAVVAAAALLAACSSSAGSSGTTTSSAPAAAATTSAPASSANATPAAIATASGPLGSYLVDKTGKAIYILTSDKPGGASACPAGTCLKAWPPVAAITPTPSGLAGITATFGTFTAADGTSELTINGYPAYNFVKDVGPGTTTGQGVVSFGGTWWLVSPTGSWITTAAASSSNAAASSSAKSGGTGYGY